MFIKDRACAVLDRHGLTIAGANLAATILLAIAGVITRRLGYTSISDTIGSISAISFILTLLLVYLAIEAVKPKPNDQLPAITMTLEEAHEPVPVGVHTDGRVVEVQPHRPRPRHRASGKTVDRLGGPED